MVALQSCRRAIDMLNSAFAEGKFGSARDARVVYGQTDSLFVSFPSSTVSLYAFSAFSVLAELESAS